MNKSFNLSDWVRPNIQELSAYTSARDQYSQGVLLDANELGLGPALSQPTSHTKQLHRYPDPYQRALRSAIADLRGVDADQVFTGNGSDEAIDLLIRIFCEPAKHHILVTPPTYGMYKVSARIHNVSVDEAPLNSDLSLDVDQTLAKIHPDTRIIFLCSPNNPTGNTLDSKAIEQVVEQFSGIVVVDEAYIDFSEQQSLSHLLSSYPNLVILQTLSKSFGLAGIRLGIALASAEIIAYFDKIKPPYNINALSAQVALEAVLQPELMQQKVQQILEERAYVQSRLQRLQALLTQNPGPVLATHIQKIYPSDANFLLVRFEQALAIQKTLAEKGVIVRYRGNELHCADTLRISIGNRMENNAFFESLIEVLGWDGPARKEIWEQLDLQKTSETDSEQTSNSEQVSGSEQPADSEQSSPRTARIERQTSETSILIELNLDGTGQYNISTGLAFFDHMLEQIARHGLIDLKISCTGDLHIDEHHTIEDVGIALGQALSMAFGDKRGIERYGFVLPMDEAQATVALDLSGRPYLVFETEFSRNYVGDLPTDMIEHFFYSLAMHMKATLQISARASNDHHKIEACFKGLARTLKQAVEHNPRIAGQIPSSKGQL